MEELIATQLQFELLEEEAPTRFPGVAGENIESNSQLLGCVKPRASVCLLGTRKKPGWTLKEGGNRCQPGNICFKHYPLL